MSLFNIFKEKPSVVWRDDKGKIRCLGDACPRKCDDTCPIWCQTMALTIYNVARDEKEIMKAIGEMKKALTLAPDFKDAWVNMAAMYGGINNHLEANKAYKAAYMIDNSYRNALFGLIISSKNLGQFEEALKYCDEYESKINKTEADKLRAQIIDAKNSGTIIRQETAIEMAVKIIDYARKNETLGSNDHFPNIPEIMALARQACEDIFKALMKESSPGAKDPLIWLCWGAYAGMGAVAHWNKDWNSLKAKGLAKTLLEPRGAFAMDEYVLDTIGIRFNTSKGQTLGKDVYAIAMYAFSQFMMTVDKEHSIPIAQETMHAMFLFGMVYEMENLGMK